MLFSGSISVGVFSTSKQSGSTEILIYSILFFLIGFSLLENVQKASSQLTPIPPPAQQPKYTPQNVVPNQVNNDTSPPVIKVITTSLIEGGNVFRAKITDEAPITAAQITFVQNGQIVSQSLVKDPASTYKALIYVHPPSAVIITSAFDLHGKTASVAKYLAVTPLSKSIHTQLTSFFFGIGKSIVSLFGLAKK